MTRRRKRWLLWGSLVSIPLLIVSPFVLVVSFQICCAHKHCIKQTGIAFRVYAADHEGRFPADTNGFGNALLLLVKGGFLGDTNGHYSVGPITGPGDDGEVFREALRTGQRIPEEKCSRVYIQGLSETNNPQIVILFDKKPTMGGDHFRRPWGPLLREVCFVDGSMQRILEKSWAAFSSNQVELLVGDGFDRATAKHYFQIP